jgi:hypothetical protein
VASEGTSGAPRPPLTMGITIASIEFAMVGCERGGDRAALRGLAAKGAKDQEGKIREQQDWDGRHPVGAPDSSESGKL